MNCLITCGGGFQGQTLISDLKLNAEVILHVADINPFHSNKYLADYSVVTPSLKNEDQYISFLRKYCIENEIKWLIPATALDLNVLSLQKEDFKNQGCTILVPDNSELSLLDHKVKSYEYLRKRGFPVQEQLDPLDKNAYPLIAKPNNGWGGLNVFKFKSIEDMHLLFKGDRQLYSWTKLLSHFDEYSIDFAVSPEGQVGQLYFRLRERVSGGFAIQSFVYNTAPDFLEPISQLIYTHFSSPKLSGIYNIQLLYSNYQITISDINCRIGTSAISSSYFKKSLLKHVFSSSNTFEKFVPVRFFRSISTTFLPEIDLKDVTHLVFDLDDTLISNRDWIIDRSQLLHKKCQALNSKINEDEFLHWVNWQLTEGKAPVLIDIIYKKFSIEITHEDLLSSYRQCYPSRLSVYTDVFSTIKQLAERGYVLSLLSDNPLSTQLKKWELFSSKSFFNHTLFTDSLNLEKPDIRAFESICHIASIPVQNSVMIGNHLYRDALGSLNAGFRNAFLIRRNNDLLAHGNLDLKSEIKSLTHLNSLNELLYYFC
jgi:FMN phosphatase YigB (HAD superfamily)